MCRRYVETLKDKRNIETLRYRGIASHLSNLFDSLENVHLSFSRLRLGRREKERASSLWLSNNARDHVTVAFPEALYNARAAFFHRSMEHSKISYFLPRETQNPRLRFRNRFPSLRPNAPPLLFASRVSRVCTRTLARERARGRRWERLSTRGLFFPLAPYVKSSLRRSGFMRARTTIPRYFLNRISEREINKAPLALRTNGHCHLKLAIFQRYVYPVLFSLKTTCVQCPSESEVALVLFWMISRTWRYTFNTLLTNVSLGHWKRRDNFVEIMFRGM